MTKNDRIKFSDLTEEQKTRVAYSKFLKYAQNLKTRATFEWILLSPIIFLGAIAANEGMLLIGISVVVAATIFGVLRQVHLYGIHAEIMKEHVHEEVLVEIRKSIKKDYPKHLAEFERVLKGQGFITNAQAVSFVKYINKGPEK